MVRNSLQRLLQRAGYDVEAVDSGDKAMERLHRNLYDVVLTDYKMCPMNGMDLLQQIKVNWPATEVIMMTAFGTIEDGVRAIKLGALDYITKPFVMDDLIGSLKKISENKSHSNGNQQESLGNVRRHREFDLVVGESPEILHVLNVALRVAVTDSTILILGESGTGKELIAHSIHALSARKEAAFIAIHCGAIPENLQESELFGHKKGTFTGAEKDKVGLLEAADGGTVFFDEIGDTSLSTQVKLLRFLQHNELRRIGENHARRVNVRLISATNKNLEYEVEQGSFRKDLFYRLNVIPITIPPLRDRKQDIPILINYFIDKFNKKLERKVSGLSKRAMSLMMYHDWPGNIRELENVIERVVALATSDQISSGMLAQCIHRNGKTLTDDSQKPIGKLAKLESEIILQTLNKMNGNKKKTAEELGISKTTLWRKLKVMSV